MAKVDNAPEGSMKLDKPVNPNYAATVIRVPKLVELPNSDNLVGIPMFGMQAIVSRGSVREGEVGIIFPAEVQLSPDFCRVNNLYRHENLNSNPEAKGYLEDNRRVRAIKLRGNRSDALFMPLSSLEFLFGYEPVAMWGVFEVGQTFDTINGQEICRKYEIPVKTPRNQQPRSKSASRIDPRLFPEHFDTTHWLRSEESVRQRFSPETEVIVTQKLHGTLLRVGNTLVSRKLNPVERILARLGVRIQKFEYDNVVGSNHVIKGIDAPDGSNHFYGTDLWMQYGSKLHDLIPKGFVVYGELIGWTPDHKPIQKHYTYDCAHGEAKFYIYRVAHVNEDGQMFDLSWDQVKEFSASIGVPHVPEIIRLALDDVTSEVVNSFMDINFAAMSTALHDLLVDDGVAEPKYVPLSPDSPCDEGICLRIDGLRPEIYKAKSPLFLQHETKVLDSGDAEEEVV